MQNQMNTFSKLTDNPKKADLYLEDSFSREGLSDLHAWASSEISELLHKNALLLLKPEAFAGRKINKTFAFMERHGFAPIAFQKIFLSGPMVHGLWRYQIRRNTIDKIRLYTRWIAQVPAAVVAVRDEHQDEVPASVRLSSLKGPAVVEKRSPWQLRSVLESPNSIMNYVHCADEPADVVRELAVLVDANGRPTFIKRMSEGRDDPAVPEKLRETEVANRRESLDPKSSGRAIANKLEPCTGADRDFALKTIEQVLKGSCKLDLYEFERACDRLEIDIDPIDMFAFGSEFIHRNIEGKFGDFEK